MSSTNLQLEDCLEDSPQTRALINVFEKDADTLVQYAQSLHVACKQVTHAQMELTNATQDLADQLRDFQNVKFVIGNQDEVIRSTLKQLVTNVDEVSSYNAVLQTQLSETMDYNTSQFLNKDLNEYLRLKSSFQTSDKLHEEAAAKLARLSKKRHSEKSWQEATDQLFASRKSFHNTSMLYCSCLNSLQNKKKIGLLRPIISYLQSQIGFFRMGSEVSQAELEEVLGKLLSDLSELEKNTEEGRDLSIEKMDQLDASSTRSYIPDPPASMNFPELSIDRAKTQISSYLFHRTKGAILSQWHRNYFFVQGGNLMMQSKNELAGQRFVDLDGATIRPIDIDDRRHVFEVTALKSRSYVVLQAESAHLCEEWIATLRNISAGLYLLPNPREAAMQVNQKEGPIQGTLELTPGTARSATPDETLGDNAQVSTPGETIGEPPNPSSPSFESRHENVRPSMFERIKMAASNLMAPETPQRESRSSSSSTYEYGEPPSVESMRLEPNEPILFDLPSPVEETANLEIAEAENQDEKTQQSSGNQQQGSGDPSQPRRNPFTSDQQQAAVIKADDVAFKAMFVVRFLGCRKVDADSNMDSIISETICHVMAARAYHKMFRMNELHLMISDASIRLIDPTSQLSRETFSASSLLRAKTLADNPRLLGFIVRHNATAMCYTFESNADGDDVCCAINTARVMEQSKIEHEESSKQREIENDLEAQSRMISASQDKAEEEQ